ncbi:hypothetical protein GF406_22330 [candidate division KSB1 bacterium]|nr:hypothetical protein [candidate division KSB1 bacterium]
MKLTTLSILLCLISTVWSQNVPAGLSELEQLKKMQEPSKTISPKTRPVLEKKIDPREYIVGPGDVFLVSIIGREDLDHEITVNPEGFVYIPNVGQVQVAESSLANAREAIKSAVQTRFSSVQITIYLLELRSFRVTVTGAVANPGLYTVDAMSRTSDALALAGGFAVSDTSELNMVKPPESTARQPFQELAPPSNSSQRLKSVDQRPSWRRIVVQRQKGEKVYADLKRAFLLGEMESNPYLLDGDVIMVPFIHPRAGMVEIAGAVNNPGEYEFVPGDCIGDLIDMAHGLRFDADSSELRLVRFEAKSNPVTLELPLYGTRDLQKTLDRDLHPDDRIFISALSDYHLKYDVEVEGQVRYPGSYAIDHHTLLSEVIERAGGFTDLAALDQAYVLRSSLQEKTDPEFERLLTMRPQEMTEIEREYFKFKYRERAGLMPIDFERLLKRDDTRHDIVLKNKDVIVIPTRGLTVSVVGQVVTPGLYPYRPGQDLDYYLTLAGGYNWNAQKRKTRVIKSKTGEWMDPDGDTIIYDGDEIFIPEKPPRDWWELTKDIIVAASQLATVYLLVERIMIDP